MENAAKQVAVKGQGLFLKIKPAKCPSPTPPFPKCILECIVAVGCLYHTPNHLHLHYRFYSVLNYTYNLPFF